MNTHHSINYIELAGGDMKTTKQFYTNLCGWEYVDYGPQYSAFTNAGIDGGFDANLDPNEHTTVILFSDDLDASYEQVVGLGGTITIEPFDFPGGRRFHFRDPVGNHIGVWAE